ncbi:MAG: hypothetical protein ABIG30_03560 [Candidatus Aenigmatarchaeota archaeon]
MKPAHGILIITILFVAAAISGCTSNPSVFLEFDKDRIEIKDFSMSNEFITATLTRQDDTKTDVIFVLKFPQNMSSVYPVDVDGNKISELETKILKGKDAKDTLQFKIFGRNDEAVESKFELKAELWWNTTKLDEKEIEVTVKD